MYSVPLHLARTLDLYIFISSLSEGFSNWVSELVLIDCFCMALKPLTLSGEVWLSFVSPRLAKVVFFSASDCTVMQLLRLDDYVMSPV